MAVSVGGVAIPDSMQDRGAYVTNFRTLLRRNGYGEPIVSGFQSVTWTFAILTQTELDWWLGTALAGQDSRSTNFVLWDDQGNEFTFTSGILYRPSPMPLRAHGKYRNVVFNFRHLLPIVDAFES